MGFSSHDKLFLFLKIKVLRAKNLDSVVEVRISFFFFYFVVVSDLYLKYFFGGGGKKNMRKRGLSVMASAEISFLKN